MYSPTDTSKLSGRVALAARTWGRVKDVEHEVLGIAQEIKMLEDALEKSNELICPCGELHVCKKAAHEIVEG